MRFLFPPLKIKRGVGGVVKDYPIRIRNRASLKVRRKELRKNQTDCERILWQKLRNRQVNHLKFFRQYSFGSYILDFYCPEIRLAIELDGGQHMTAENKEYDQQRTSYLEANEVRVLRFWNTEALNNLEEVLTEVLAECHNSSQPPLNLKRRGSYASSLRGGRGAL